jgi:hypothetical protein
MAKHRKTRREKKVADLRHNLYHLETNIQVETVKTKDIKVKEVKIETPSIKSVSYAYVLKDVKKILLVSSAIILGQFVLFFIINRI